MRFPLPAVFRPKPALSKGDIAHGLSMWTWEGVAASGFGSLVSGGLLAAFALALGANSLQIGILASLPMITQVVQIPGVILVERTRRRKAIVVLSQLPGQLLWVPVALIPLLLPFPSAAAVSVLLGLMALRGLLSAFTNSSWQTWIKDLIPRDLLGRSIARRTAMTTVMAAVVGIVAAVLVQRFQTYLPPEQHILAFTGIILLGVFSLGLGSPFFMSRMAEPLMAPPAEPRPSLARSLLSPVRDRNYRQLLCFLTLWGFSLNLAVPFFAVYLLTQLHVPLSGVIALAVLSQLASVISLDMWGKFVDRFGAKAIISISASLYLLVMVGWTFTTVPERQSLIYPILAILHLFGGIASGGVSVGTGTIGLKLAPEGRAPPYLGAGSLASNLGGGLGPLVGGLLAQFFSARTFTVELAFRDPGTTASYAPFSLTGFEFLFVISFLLGLFSLSILGTLREEGEVAREVVLKELFAQAPGRPGGLGPSPGPGPLAHFPFAYIKRVPGLEAALGVTAYQVAAATQAAAALTDRGRSAAGDVAERVALTVGQMISVSEDIGETGRDLARHATRGVMKAATGVTEDMRFLVSEGVRGVLLAFDRARENAHSVVWGASFGAVEGSQEVGGDVVAAAVQAVRTASSAGVRLGLSPEAAAREAAQGALEAAAALGPVSLQRVRQSLEAIVPEARPLAPDSPHPEGRPAADIPPGVPQPQGNEG